MYNATMFRQRRDPGAEKVHKGARPAEAETKVAGAKSADAVTAVPSMEEIEAERKRLQKRLILRRTAATAAVILLVVAAVSVLATTLFLPVLQVSGTSMEPTLSDGDVIVLVSKSRYEAGDVVGFYSSNKLLLKRIIAGPGDRVSVDADGNVSVNGEPLDEPYVQNRSLGSHNDLNYPVVVPDGCFFVMGDNRISSVDSRSREIGFVRADQIDGKVILRVWPLRRLSAVR